MTDDKTEKTGLPLHGMGPRQVLQDLQNALTDMIRCNITFLDPQGKKILEPSRCTVFCHEMHTDTCVLRPEEGPDCISQTFELSMLNDASLHICRHKMHFSTIKLRYRDRVVAVVILGPFVMHKRKSLPQDAFAYDPDLGEIPQTADGETPEPESNDYRMRDFKVLSREKLTEIENFTKRLFDSLIVLSRPSASEADLPGQ